MLAVLWRVKFSVQPENGQWSVETGRHSCESDSEMSWTLQQCVQVHRSESVMRGSQEGSSASLMSLCLWAELICLTTPTLVVGLLGQSGHIGTGGCESVTPRGGVMQLDLDAASGGVKVWERVGELVGV